MRLFPPAWSLARTTAKEIEIGGYRLPVGANVVMSPWIMHRDPRFFERPNSSIRTAGPLRLSNSFHVSHISPLGVDRASVLERLSP